MPFEELLVGLMETTESKLRKLANDRGQGPSNFFKIIELITTLESALHSGLRDELVKCGKSLPTGVIKLDLNSIKPVKTEDLPFLQWFITFFELWTSWRQHKQNCDKV